MKHYTTCWGAAWTIIGGVVGAGFATGREVWEFFGVHPDWWREGIILATVLMFGGAAALMVLGDRADAAHYRDLLVAIWGPRLAVVADAVAAMAFFTGLVVVLAGTGEVADHVLGVGQWAGLLAGAALMSLLVRLEPRALVRLQGLLVPVLMALWVLLWLASGAVSAPDTVTVPRPVPRPWWLSASLYASYNLLLAAAVVPAVVGCTGSRVAHALKSAAISCIIMGGVTGALLARVRALIPGAATSPLPFGQLAEAVGGPWPAAYILALTLALVTTGVACLYGLCARWAPPGASRTLLALGLIALALPPASLGLVRMVGALYPLLGWVGMATLMVTLIRVAGR